MSFSSSSWSMARPCRICQFAVSIVTFATAAAVLGTVAHTLRVFTVQRAENNPWWLPLWPQHFDTTGTYALIATSALVLVLNFLYILAFAIPKFSHSTSATSAFVITSAVSLGSLAIALFSIIYAQVINNRVATVDTIQTWTCRFRKVAVATPGTTIPPTMSNDSFNSLCMESKFAFFGTVAVAALELIILLTAVVGWSKERSAQKNGMDWQDKAPSPSLS